VFSRGTGLPLSERVPLLENLGFRVGNERTYRVGAPGSLGSRPGLAPRHGPGARLRRDHRRA
jgi:NAD-specific glutamate dehydrogenase